MRQVTVETHISAPREQVFDFLADLAGRPAYTDHYLQDYRLARVNPYGMGAAARFLLRAPLAKEYAELEVVEADRPRRLVEEVRVGRLGRSRSVAVYELMPEAGGITRVELTTYSEPGTRIDALKQLGAARWLRRQTGIALERLRMIFEEPPAAPLARATIAGWEPLNAPRFGLPAGRDPSRTGTTPALACLLTVAALPLGGCFGKEDPEELGREEPVREGLSVPFEGVDYNVFITRQLNTRIPPDEAYYHGPAPPEGETLYGVFLQACNNTDRSRQTAGHFIVVDNQGNEFEPRELPERNEFAYRSKRLQPEECQPQAGSVAQLGPTAGSMLLFQLPLNVTENRPLELEIGEGPEALKVELDI